MKRFIKDLAWKAPLLILWWPCTPWMCDTNLTDWDKITICIGFILSLDLIRWGLKKEGE